MQRIKAAICDDDLFFALELKTKIENILLTSTINVTFDIDVFSSAKELLENYSSEYSICFLDICINEENGINAGIQLKTDFPDTILIFVTSFIDFSLDGYKANAFRYILKNSVDTLLPECVMESIKKLSLDVTSISLNVHGESVTIRANTIMYIESFSHQQMVHLSNGQSLECNMTLERFEKQVHKLSFIKPHKSFLVNCQYIEKFQNYTIILKDTSCIPIARNKYASFKRDYLQYLGSI